MLSIFTVVTVNLLAKYLHFVHLGFLMESFMIHLYKQTNYSLKKYIYSKRVNLEICDATRVTNSVKERSTLYNGTQERYYKYTLINFI